MTNASRATLHGQTGFSMIEVLVALFVLSLTAAAFLSFAGAFSQGILRARQWQAAVTCAEHVVESVRSGLLTVGQEPVTGRCGAGDFPLMTFKLTAHRVPATGEDSGIDDGTSGTVSWAAVTVSVFPNDTSSRPLYSLTTARSLGVSGP